LIPRLRLLFQLYQVGRLSPTNISDIGVCGDTSEEIFFGWLGASMIKARQKLTQVTLLSLDGLSLVDDICVPVR
jgi:hypothetical protein